MAANEEFERLMRYIKKVANPENERDKRFRALDNTLHFIKQNINSESFHLFLEEKLTDILTALGNCLPEYSRRKGFRFIIRLSMIYEFMISKKIY